MGNRIRDHIRSNVVGYIALFCFAMGGTAYATHPGGRDTISSGDIINGEVRNKDLGADSVGSGKIADRQVKNADLSIGASSSNTVADGGIQGVDVKNNTLTGDDIDELALDFAALQARVADACPAGEAIREVHQDGTVTCESVGGGGGSFWSLAGNSGTASSDFLGTTDNSPLNLRVNNARGLRLEPASDGTNQSPNVIGGIADNAVAAGVFAATIGGGGRGNAAEADTANTVTDDGGTVGGGGDNQAGDGAGTTSDQSYATVAGGVGNTAGGSASAVAGGFSNSASGTNAAIGGGQANTASAQYVAVGGGNSNAASGPYTAVGGGQNNTASGIDATVAGGAGNTAAGADAAVPGGLFNAAQGDNSFAAGRRAKANHAGSFVWGDSTDTDVGSTTANQFTARASGGVRLFSSADTSGATAPGVQLFPNSSALGPLGAGNPFDIRVGNGTPSDRGLRIEPASDSMGNQSPNVIGGRGDNSVTAGVHSATIGGGGRTNPASPATANEVTDSLGTIGGGGSNQAGDGAGTLSDQAAATVGGGTQNAASALHATVGGGLNNTASGRAATVPGGQSNTAQGLHSFAAGVGAEANHSGAFVWADSSANPNFSSTAINQFSVRSEGGARFVSEVDVNTGNPMAGVELAPGGGSWSSLSDVASKRAIEPVSGLEVLRRLGSVPISTWSYRSQDVSTRHIGPMAQDFFRAFGVGEDRRHISSVDADGVALAAIKGLNRKVERLERKLASLKEEKSR